VIVNNNQYSMMNEEYRIMNKEPGRKIPVQGRLIPEGLHVYRKAVNRENSTPREVGISTSFQPAGVVQPVVSYCFYKRLMSACSADRPPESGSQKTEGERVRGCENERVRGYESERMRGCESERMRGCESERVRNGEIVIENNNQYSMMNEEYRIMNKEPGRKIPVQGRLIPEGLHVYRKAVNRENSTPAGVAHFNSFWYIYKHLMPACSADRPLASGKPDRCTETLNGNTMQVTAHDTAHDTRRLGNALGDKQTKTNLKNEMKNKTRLAGLLADCKKKIMNNND